MAGETRRTASEAADTIDASHTVHWEVFVVRVWREAASGAWRGEVVHLPDRASSYFASFAQAEEFMRRYVSSAETRQPIEERNLNEADAV